MQQEPQKPYQAYLAGKAAADRLAAAFRFETERRHGSTRNFHKKLLVDVITHGNDPLLSDYYNLYSRLFAGGGAISLSRFQQAIDRTHDAALQAKYGPLAYEISIIREPETKEILAGTSYLALARRGAPLDDFYHGTLSGNFTFVTPEARSIGLSHVLQELRLDRARIFFGQARGEAAESMRVLAFNEHNNPLAMTPASYLADTCEAGIDQFDRMAYWQGRGYRRLPFDYVEPHGAGCDKATFDLCLNVCNEHEAQRNLPDGKTPPQSVSAETILFHLRGFYAACNLGEQPVEIGTVFNRQKEELTRRKSLTPCDDRAIIKDMGAQVVATLTEMSAADAEAEDRVIGDILGLRWPQHTIATRPQNMPSQQIRESLKR